MPLQNFIDKITSVTTPWLNSVDVLLFTVFGTPTTKAQARTALTSDAPFSLAQGGTGGTTAATARAGLGSTTVGDAVFIASTAAVARSALGLGTVSTLTSDTDGTLAANSDSNVATQKATKTYVDTQTTKVSGNIGIFSYQNFT